MLRYFYLLICIHVSFSYDFTERIRSKGLKLHNNRKHNVESKVVNLDMESFMSPDVDSQDFEPFDLSSKLKRRTQNEDYYESPINEFKSEENVGYSNFNEVNNRETEDALKCDNPMHVQNSEKEKKNTAAKERAAEDTPVERHAAPDPEKKCLFRKMKIPFFSHKKTKQHIKKIDCGNCGHLYTNDPESQANENTNQIAQRFKRAHGNVCPNCIRKFMIPILNRFNLTPDKVQNRNLSNPETSSQKQNSKKKYKITPDKVQNRELINIMAVQATGSKNKKQMGNNNVSYNDQTKIREKQRKHLEVPEMKLQKVKMTTPVAYR